MRPVFASHIFCEDAALIQPKINGTLQPFFEGQFSWVWYAGIIQHNRIKLVLSSVGQIVEQYIKSIPGIDVYVIMPNHVHMIIMKSNGKPIYSEIRSFKGLTVKNSPGLRWQRNYYEHVIRDDEDYRVKREYIEDNPRR